MTSLSFLIIVIHLTAISNGVLISKRRTFTAVNNDQDGATINVDTRAGTNDVDTNGGTWSIDSTVPNYWHLITTLDSSWGFHQSVTSSITISINSDTSMPTPPDDAHLQVIFSDISQTKYFGVMNALESDENNMIMPKSTTSTTFISGDADDIVSSSCTNCWRFVLLATNNYNGNSMSPVCCASAGDQNWPQNFTVENDMVNGKTNFYSQPRTGTTQTRIYDDSFPTNEGLIIYIALAKFSEHVHLTSIDIEYKYESNTDEPTSLPPTTEQPTTENPSHAIATPTPTTFAPTTTSPTTNIPTTFTPTTSSPTTSGPTTNDPTTSHPTSMSPSTTAPMTNNPTPYPTTSTPTTSNPTPVIPTTSVPSSSLPTTSRPTTDIPTISPSTSDPTTENPTSSSSIDLSTSLATTTAVPVTPQPTTISPTEASSLITSVPSTLTATTSDPTTDKPTKSGSSSGSVDDPTTTKPTEKKFEIQINLSKNDTNLTMGDIIDQIDNYIKTLYTNIEYTLDIDTIDNNDDFTILKITITYIGTEIDTEIIEGELNDIYGDENVDISIINTPTTTNASKNKKREPNMTLFNIVVTAAILFFVGICILICCASCKKLRKRKEKVRNMAESIEMQSKEGNDTGTFTIPQNSGHLPNPNTFIHEQVVSQSSVGVDSQSPASQASGGEENNFKYTDSGMMNTNIADDEFIVEGDVNNMNMNDDIVTKGGLMSNVSDYDIDLNGIMTKGFVDINKYDDVDNIENGEIVNEDGIDIEDIVEIMETIDDNEEKQNDDTIFIVTPDGGNKEEEIWNGYINRFGYEPENASHLQQFVRNSEFENITFKEARIIISIFKDKGMII